MEFAENTMMFCVCPKRGIGKSVKAKLPSRFCGEAPRKVKVFDKSFRTLYNNISLNY